MNKKIKIYVAGHTGLVGSAIIKNLRKKDYNNLILRTHAQLDLTNQLEVHNFFKNEKPDWVILAAAKVGGIVANNSYRADFIYQNLMIQNNVIHHSYLYGVKKLLFLGSTCVYPKHASQPIEENSLLTSELEYTNEPYAIAKIAGIKMCESYNVQYGTNFISVMPTNLYGPNDNFDLETSHVLPALIRKIHLGKCLDNKDFIEIRRDLDKNPIEGIDGSSSESLILNILEKYGVKIGQVEIWGTGKPQREFLWSEDMADACVFLMQNKNFSDFVSKNGNNTKNTHINIGTGVDISIIDLAYLIKKHISYTGDLFFNASKPDGVLKKMTDIKKLNALGWNHTLSIEKGVEKMYAWYMA